jgi:transcriptional regulator with XRE-family HTH domain/quercetin dioxygenase-like cupin family protein
VKPLAAVANPEKTTETGQHARDPVLSLEKCVGTAVRALRLRHQLTIAQVAEGAAISAGMLSKIENGQISAGMDTLSRVARALGSTMAMLFRTYDVPAGAAHLVKRGEGMPFLRQGIRPGHTFEFLSYDQGPSKAFDAFLVTITEDSENLPTVEHPGTELIYVLEGVMEYRSGQNLYLLEQGDTLTLQGEVLHGFERLIQLPIRFLCTIVYSSPLAPTT